MKRVLFITVIFLFFMAGSTNAQENKGDSWIYGGVTLPQGDFGDETGLDAGGAKLSFGIGYDMNKPMSTPGLFWTTSLAVLLNGFETSEIESEIRSELPSGVDFDLDAGKWINIPIFTGFKYQKEASPTMDFYGIGQAGLNFVKAPKVEITANGVSGELKYDLATSFGFCVGGGVVLKDNKMNIGFRYYLLGEPEIEGNIEVDSSREELKIEQPISIMMISVGITF